jgi:hypothetical protein
MSRVFSYSSFVVRWFVALFLVLATYNPSGYSYVHWLMELSASLWAFKALAGLLLIVLYGLFGLATVRSLGSAGIGLMTLLSGALIWVAADLKLLTAFDMPMTVMLVVANVLAVGVSWSHIRQRLSGQVDSNNVGIG